MVAVAALALAASCGPQMDAPAESASAEAASAEEGVFGTIAPFRSHGPVHDADNVEAMRPRVMGTHGVISSGHYLATQAGYDVLRAGGNAFDAGVTAGMALKVLKMDYAGWTGVAPLIVYSATEDRVIARVGAGTSPALATLDYFLEHGKSPINNALIPADVDVWLSALDRFGTLSFGEAALPALRVAEDRGDPARAVDRFFREHDGIVRYEDMAGYESRWEEPLGTSFNGYDVHTGDGWSQGPRSTSRWRTPTGTSGTRISRPLRRGCTGRRTCASGSSSSTRTVRFRTCRRGATRQGWRRWPTARP